MRFNVVKLACLGSGVALLAFPVFPSVTWQWISIIGIPSVSLNVPNISWHVLALTQRYWRFQHFCSILVVFPSWPAMFVVPMYWLACFAARWSVGVYGCLRAHSHVHCLCMPSSIWRVLFLVCLCVPSLPRFLSFYFFFCFSTDLFSVIGAHVLPWGDLWLGCG